MINISRHRCICLDCEIESVVESRIRPFFEEGWDVPPCGPTLREPDPITEHAGLCPVCNPDYEADAVSDGDGTDDEDDDAPQPNLGRLSIAYGGGVP